MIAKEATLKEISEMLTHVVEHVATKDDIARFDRRMDELNEWITGASQIFR